FAMEGSPTRGTWVIDLEGVSYHPCRGASRFLKWSAVERVYWSLWHAIFRGEGVTIPLPWNSLPRDQIGPARGRVEKVLSPQVDLSRYSLSKGGFDDRPLSPRARLTRFGRLIGISFAVTAVWGAGLFYLIRRFPARSEGIWVFESFFMGPLLLLF